ncbi:SDR family oxidoreductase [Halieaceae bacterium IMCC14734]|uniref:SDR family oxidoreductase n=1 Tax=Candidatus Litorirhabdus singularis TaxID=2518993 RepID=A0ABT3TGX3_9GAMM|nr:SDR family oxidoreductase [Candidatus Litorirhabdus singularis]MCX2981566.1 SDR family oxidoreductase [Candidatus Litorirhabdus singularis]
MQLHLKDKTALVTGSHRGTGSVIAATLEKEGCQLISHAINEVDRSEHGYSVWGDLATVAGCEQVLEQIAATDLNVDILVNNYGTADRHNWQDTDTDKWLQMYELNVLSAARMAQGLTPGMRERGWGRVINLGTIGSHQPNSIMPAYYAAKGALATLGVSLALELANTGITVNTVSPGYVRTDEVEAGYTARARKRGLSEDWDEVQKMIVETDFPNPCGRIAEREEVADLVAFLVSTRAGFINGQNIRIDGGAVRYV